MPLIDEISAAITAAMKAKDPARLAPLRMAKAALMNREVEKGRPLDETEAQQVVASLIKQRRDSIEQFLKGGRQELAARETAEIAVLETYLPPPVDPAEIERCYRAGANSYICKPLHLAEISVMATQLVTYWSNCVKIPSKRPAAAEMLDRHDFRVGSSTR